MTTLPALRATLLMSGRAVRGIAWYPGLLALALVLEVVIATAAPVESAIRVLVLMSVGATLITTVLTVVIRDRVRGGLIALAIVWGVLTAHDLAAVAPLVVALVVLLVERHWASRSRHRLPWPRIHEAFTIFLTILVVVELGTLLMASSPTPPPFDRAWTTDPASTGLKPDIFILVADAHGRADVLRTGFAYDPAPLLGTLESLGFDVASRSRSNYLFTELSLTSFLSGSQLHDLGLDMTQPMNKAWAATAVAANPTFDLMRRNGYEVVVVSSGYEHLGLRSADRFVDTGQPNEFEVSFVETTSFLTRDFAASIRVSAARDRTPANIRATVAIAQSESHRPLFVLTHVPAPHYPYVVDASCIAIASGPGTMGASARYGKADAHEIRLVAEQTACVDRLLQRAVSEIATARPQAIVILMSDHGPDERLEWASPDPVGIGDRSANLFAARTPGHPDLFPDDVTLVNVLPLLFDTYFGMHLPLRPNEIWFGPRPQDGTFYLVDPG